jgi:hypothetical protein
MNRQAIPQLEIASRVRYENRSVTTYSPLDRPGALPLEILGEVARLDLIALNKREPGGWLGHKRL